MELKVTSERVLAAAEKCTNAKNILKELFPEVFESKPVELHLNKAAEGFVTKENKLIVSVRSGGEYKNRALYLNPNYNWELVPDDLTFNVLIAKEK